MELMNHYTSSYGKIRVVTGPQGVGKTTYCEKMVEVFKASGIQPDGFVTPGRYTQTGEKTGIYLKDMKSRDLRLLASSIQGEIEGIPLGPWVFDPVAIQHGRDILEDSKTSTVMIVDEVGPLEFDLKLGWNEVFEFLRKRDFCLAVVVIRPECLEKFAGMGFVFDVDEISSPFQAISADPFSMLEGIDNAGMNEK